MYPASFVAKCDVSHLCRLICECVHVVCTYVSSCTVVRKFVCVCMRVFVCVYWRCVCMCVHILFICICVVHTCVCFLSVCICLVYTMKCLFMCGNQHNMPQPMLPNDDI